MCSHPLRGTARVLQEILEGAEHLPAPVLLAAFTPVSRILEGV
ncbi:MAG TPA: hypothetical protein VH394_04980 [Thermoanaerobaculia bacterium]|nr:hypothetical protein [Thermoanaerobaculia bacterium]